MSNLLKVDELKSLFNCRFCSNLFVNPVALPCGVSVCESHVAEIEQYRCIYCDKKHAKNEYKVNDILKKMLEIQVDSIKLSPKFDSCKNNINDAKLIVEQIDLLQNDSENYIYEYFEKIKRQVDLRREELKVEIDGYYDKVIEDITKTQKSFMKMATEMNEMNTNIETNKKELDEISKQFDSFDINDQKFEDILKKVEQLKPKMNEIIKDHKYSLTGNRDYHFNVESISIERIFGTFGNYITLISRILNNKQEIDLFGLCEFPRNTKWKLIYRASEHGFGGQAYYKKCNNAENTLTVIKSTNNNIFGGYINAALVNNGGFVSDQNSFIFSLINSDNSPFKAKCVDNWSNRFDVSSGPKFGQGYDIFISSNSNQNQTSYSNFGYSYEDLKYPNNNINYAYDYNYDYQDFHLDNGTQKCLTILAGSYNFQTVEIEVYTKDI